MRKYFNDIKWLIVLLLLALPIFLFTWKYQGHFVLDLGRELFYPQRILEGSVLYKDLFNIYGAFPYLYNALLYKIFGINLNVLQVSGVLTACGIVSMVYLISRLFFDKLLSFSLGFLALVLGCFSFHLFNFVLPYSFAMTYGLLFALIGIYLLIIFSREKIEKLYLLSALFIGLAISCKYEFLPLVLVFGFVEWKLGFDLKRCLKLLACVLMPTVICFSILFLQGLTIPALVRNFKDIYAMATSQTLKFFYIISGLTFKKPTLGLLIRSFFWFVAPLIVFIYSYVKFHSVSKWKTIFLSIAAFVVLSNHISNETFLFLPVTLFVLACIFFRKQSFSAQILTLCALLMSLKVFWGTALNSYGVFFIPILLIAVTKYLKPDYRKLVGMFLIFVSIMFISTNINARKQYTGYVKTNKGSMHIDGVFNKNANAVIDFLRTKTSPEDRVVIFPEGLVMNFLADRKSDDYYNSLLPLYIETFGEKRLINHFNQVKPEYIIFHSFPTENYYFKSICKDFGLEFCSAVQKQYSPERFYNGSFQVLILKRN